MFFKNESLNKIACVFDPKADHATKIKREYEQVLECNEGIVKFQF